jgi:energy-coupling factor transporter ATP-binding protein EcfA2
MESSSSKKWMVLGKSESGKTTLVDRLTGALGKPIYLIGEITPTTPSSWKSISLEEVPHLSDCVLIFEDLVHCSDLVNKTVRKVMGFAAHHRGVDSVVVTQSLAKNNVLSLLPFLSELFITLAKSNASLVSKALDYYKFSKMQRDSHLKTFLAAEGKYGYFILKPDAMSFLRGDVTAAVGGNDHGASPTREDFFSTAESLLAELERPKRALAIFNIVLSKLSPSEISPHDLSIKVYRKASGHPLNLSLVDYIHSLLGDIRPSKDIASLHLFLRKRGVVIPVCFISNKYMIK